MSKVSEASKMMKRMVKELNIGELTPARERIAREKDQKEAQSISSLSAPPSVILALNRLLCSFDEGWKP
jgi:hypothetical protein